MRSSTTLGPTASKEPRAIRLGSQARHVFARLANDPGEVQWFLNRIEFGPVHRDAAECARISSSRASAGRQKPPPTGRRPAAGRTRFGSDLTCRRRESIVFPPRSLGCLTPSYPACSLALLISPQIGVKPLLPSLYCEVYGPGRAVYALEWPRRSLVRTSRPDTGLADSRCQRVFL